MMKLVGKKLHESITVGSDVDSNQSQPFAVDSDTKDPLFGRHFGELPSVNVVSFSESSHAKRPVHNFLSEVEDDTPEFSGVSVSVTQFVKGRVTYPLPPANIISASKHQGVTIGGKVPGYDSSPIEFIHFLTPDVAFVWTKKGTLYVIRG